jgi:hypothetical protein
VPPPVREQPLAEGSAPLAACRDGSCCRRGSAPRPGWRPAVIGVSLVAQGQRRPIGGEPPLVTGEGFWAEVAKVEDVPPGNAVRFSTAAFDGFVVNDGGTIARSHRSAPTWAAPCLSGRTGRTCAARATAPASGSTGALPTAGAPGRARALTAATRTAYPIELPDLVRPEVKVAEGVIWVWTAQA